MRRPTGALAQLTRELRRIPGVGSKSAQRMAFYLIKAPKDQALALADAIRTVRERVKPCPNCGNLSELNPCEICSDPTRHGRALCIVEETNDLWAIEASGEFRGRYHVLGGVLSPLDGIGPDELRIGALVERVRTESPTEVIVATNPTAEGEATALYIARLLKPLGVAVTRIARGLPVGGDLEYADPMTMAKALECRTELS